MTAKNKRIAELVKQAQTMGIDVEEVLKNELTSRDEQLRKIYACLNELDAENIQWLTESSAVIKKGVPFGYAPVLDKPTGLLNIMDLNKMVVVSPFPMNPSTALEWLENNLPRSTPEADSED